MTGLHQLRALGALQFCPGSAAHRQRQPAAGRPEGNNAGGSGVPGGRRGHPDVQGVGDGIGEPAPVVTGGATEIPGSGTGLVGLAERAALSGGRLEHGLDSQGEFRLRAWLPWPA